MNQGLNTTPNGRAAGGALQRLVIVTLAALLAGGLTAALGTWQVSRAHEKERLQERQEAALRAAPQPLLDEAGRVPSEASLDGVRLTVRGRFDSVHTVYLDNRTQDGKPGFHVLTPLRLTGSDRSVLVLRGWIALNPAARNVLPAVSTPEGETVVTAEGALKLEQPMQLAQEPTPGPQDRLWQHIDFDRFARWSGLQVIPLWLREEANGAPDDGLVRSWNRPGAGSDRHWGYALQWFVMSALILAGWLVYASRYWNVFRKAG